MESQINNELSTLFYMKRISGVVCCVLADAKSN
jgi:hypothetical protein